jgi:hypothetical protein
MTQLRTPLSVSLLALGAALGACNESPTHDLGYTAEDLTRNEEPSLPPVAELSSEFAGTWVGEADDPLALLSGADVSPPAFVFPSGSSRIVLELHTPDREPGEVGYVTGTIRFGQGVLPPATDPDLGYPVDPDFRVASAGLGDTSVLPPFEGFAYSVGSGVGLRELAAIGLDVEDELDFLNEGRVVDGMLGLSYLPAEVFGSWCALQTQDSCPSNEQISWDDETAECFMGIDFTPMDCQKASQCYSGICSCADDGSACGHSLESFSELTLRFSDDGLVGLFSGAVFVNERGFAQPLGTVRFRRAEAADAGTP